MVISEGGNRELEEEGEEDRRDGRKRERERKKGRENGRRGGEKVEHASVDMEDMVGDTCNPQRNVC